MIVIKTELKELPLTCTSCPYFHKFTGVGNADMVEYGDNCEVVGCFTADAIKKFNQKQRYDKCPLQEIEGGNNDD